MTIMTSVKQNPAYRPTSISLSNHFEMNIEEASVGSYEYGYLLMLSLPLLILVGVIMLSREARKNKR